MANMWQKNSKNQLYQDICKGNADDGPEAIYNSLTLGGCMIPKSKEDRESLMYRKTGNHWFEERKWLKAIDLYNRALCSAKSSELISLAYANRSACFFELKMYDKCLVDITLATQENFPQRLMYKLDRRRADCLQLIESGAQSPSFETKLSFDPDERFPCMANVLEVKRNVEFGRHVTAKCDVGAGETVVMEKFFMTAHRYEKFKRCDGCMKMDDNLIPCNKCTNTMFCSNECKINNFHKVECNLQVVPVESQTDNQLNIIRTVLEAINMFSNVEELQTFVENAIFSDPMEVPESILDEKSRYRGFLKIWYEPNAFKRNMFGQQVYFVYKKLLDNPIIGPKFNSKPKQLFFMHLVAQHFCIINYSGNIIFDNSDDLVGWFFTENRSVIAMYVSHSCAPNATVVSYNEYNLIVTIRPIKKGEQLFLSYFRYDKIKHSTADRKKYLLARSRFECKCERCKGNSPSKAERDVMQMDECFRYIKINKQKMKYGMDGPMQTEDVKMMEEKCVEFLNKHGSKVWCEEIDFVVDCYRRLLSSKFKNEILF